MDHDEFHQNIDNKLKLYDENTVEIEFLSFLYDIIDCNYKMFERIYGYIKTINNRDVTLYQIPTIQGGIKHFFPNTIAINKVQKVKTSFEQKLYVLLDSIMPAYDRNRYFLNILENMSTNTLIDRKLISKFGEQSKIVVQFAHDFEDLFQNFQIADYRKYLNDIQSLATQLDRGEIIFKEAKKSLDNILRRFDEIRNEMKKTLGAATKLGFTKLQDATKKFHCYATKDLNSTILYKSRSSRGLSFRVCMEGL